MLCSLDFFFVIGPDGPLSASCHNIVHLQHAVPYYVFETRFCMYYPERGYRMGIASLLRLFNGWRILVVRVTELFMPVTGGNFICLGSLM